MTKPIIGLFVFGCGSAPVGFSASASVELDGAVDVRAFGMATGGATGSGGRMAAGAGGRVGTGGQAQSGAGGVDINDPRSGADPACGPYRLCIQLTQTTAAELARLGCATDADCCHGYHCNATQRIGGQCMLPQEEGWTADREMCASDLDCPCTWKCVQMYESDGGLTYGHYCAPGGP